METAETQYVDLLKKCLSASIYDESAWCVIEGAKDLTLKRPVQFVKRKVYHSILNFFRKRSILLVQKKPFDQHRRELGLDWPCFGYTMVGRQRLDNVQHCVEQVLRDNVPGDFMETGVWRGGTSIFMRALLKANNVADRTVWAADSFEGMPEPVSSTDGADLRSTEYLQVSLEQVKANFAKFGLLDDQVRFVKGWFCDTLPSVPVQKLAILRLDGDMYSSTMDALRNLHHKVSPGGFVIVDDYYAWEPCQRAVADFFQETGIRHEIVNIDGTGAYWRLPVQ